MRRWFCIIRGGGSAMEKWLMTDHHKTWKIVQPLKYSTSSCVFICHSFVCKRYDLRSMTHDLWLCLISIYALTMGKHEVPEARSLWKKMHDSMHLIFSLVNWIVWKLNLPETNPGQSGWQAVSWHFKQSKHSSLKVRRVFLKVSISRLCVDRMTFDFPDWERRKVIYRLFMNISRKTNH